MWEFFTAEEKMRGFTLTELLVVIAIIGMLASIVTASLNIARIKSTNAEIQQTLSNMRSQAEIYYVEHGAYSIGNAVFSWTKASNVCATAPNTSVLGDPVMQRAIENVDDANGPITGTGQGAVGCAANANKYIIGVEVVGGGGYWCIDSAGSSKLSTAALTNTVPTNMVCP